MATGMQNKLGHTDDQHVHGFTHVVLFMRVRSVFLKYHVTTHHVLGFNLGRH